MMSMSMMMMMMMTALTDQVERFKEKHSIGMHFNVTTDLLNIQQDQAAFEENKPGGPNVCPAFRGRNQNIYCYSRFIEAENKQCHTSIYIQINGI